jgi:hypothetical protein
MPSAQSQAPTLLLTPLYIQFLLDTTLSADLETADFMCCILFNFKT